MKNTSLIGTYIVLGMLATCVSIILALLKLVGVASYSWLWVASPVLGLIVFATAICSFVFGIMGLKSTIKSYKQEYATKNITNQE